MKYTVNQLGELASISVRTLHYYDEIGLLTPSFVAKNGYRYYEDKELIHLQQILFFRELDFPLADIKRMLNRPHFDMVAALRDQKKLMRLKRDRLDGLIKSIEKTIISVNSNKTPNSEEMYDAFKDGDVKQYQDEVKQRWGDSGAYKQNMARVSKMTKAQMDKLKEDGKKFTQKLANESKDVDPASDEAMKLVAEHHKGISYFYECPVEMYRNLGQMYVDDARFTAYYDKFRPGLAAWLCDAINHYCDTHK